MKISPIFAVLGVEVCPFLLYSVVNTAWSSLSLCTDTVMEDRSGLQEGQTTKSVHAYDVVL